MHHWALIRAFYLQCVHERQLTQKAIVARGGLSSQSVLSRMVNNDGHGPTIDVFVSAVQGLGMEVEQFFIELKTYEQQRQARAEVRDVQPSPLLSAAPDPPSREEQLRASLMAAIADVVPKLVQRFLDSDRDGRDRDARPGSAGAGTAALAGGDSGRRGAHRAELPAAGEGALQQTPHGSRG